MKHIPLLASRFCCVILLVAFCGFSPSRAAVNLIIDNQSGSNIWIQWTGMPVLTGTSGDINIAPSDYGVNAEGYQLSTFNSIGTNVYEITNYSMQGGRMWFTEGDAGFTFDNTGYTPALSSFGDSNFTVRYDKIEGSITGSTDDNMNMTALDGFSVPFTITAYNSTNTVASTQTLKGSDSNQILAALSALAANPTAPAPPSPYPSVTSNSPYLVINNNSQGITSTGSYQYSPVTSTGSFVRVIANDQTVTPLQGTYSDPVVAANGGTIPANYLYKPYDNYIAKMDGTAASGTFSGTTTIKGQFAGLGAAATNDSERKQNYDLTATFDATASMTMTNPLTGMTSTYTGVVTLTGSTYLLEGANANTTKSVIIKIPYQQMTQPTGIVGANSGYAYSYDGGTSWSYTGTAGPQNNVFTWLAGDLQAGMNVGTVGSTVSLSQAITINGHYYAAGTLIGEMDSQDWFSLGQALKAQNGGTGSVYDYYYGYLQGSADYYNAYSAALYPLTDAYGYAYGERIQGGSVAVSWDATKTDSSVIDTIVITILPDQSVPEPGTVALVVLGAGGLCFAARRRQRDVASS